MDEGPAGRGDGGAGGGGDESAGGSSHAHILGPRMNIISQLLQSDASGSLQPGVNIQVFHRNAPDDTGEADSSHVSDILSALSAGGASASLRVGGGFHPFAQLHGGASEDALGHSNLPVELFGRPGSANGNQSHRRTYSRRSRNGNRVTVVQHIGGSNSLRRIGLHRSRSGMGGAPLLAGSDEGGGGCPVYSIATASRPCRRRAADR